MNCRACLFAGGIYYNSCFCLFKRREVLVSDDCRNAVPRVRQNPFPRRKGPRNIVDKWMLEQPEKIQWFAANYGNVRNQVIAQKLGIHEVRVPVVARQLGLKPDQRRKGWKWRGKGEKEQRLPRKVSTDHLSKALSIVGLSPEQVTTCICALMKLTSDL